MRKVSHGITEDEASDEKPYTTNRQASFLLSRSFCHSSLPSKLNLDLAKTRVDRQYSRLWIEALVINSVHCRGLHLQFRKTLVERSNNVFNLIVTTTTLDHSFLSGCICQRSLTNMFSHILMFFFVLF